MFRKLKERIRDHTRDELCVHLRSLGIQAEMSERGRPEEKITHGLGKSLGIIDIQDALIRWVDVKRGERGSAGQDGSGTDTTWLIVYGVPDSRITAGFHEVEIRTKRIKKFPIFGKVIDAKWAGKDFGLGLIERLSHDVSLNTILPTLDFEIGAYPENSCWIILQHDRLSPSVELWDCYQAIAEALLAMPLPPDE